MSRPSLKAVRGTVVQARLIFLASVAEIPVCFNLLSFSLYPSGNSNYSFLIVQ